MKIRHWPLLGLVLSLPWLAVAQSPGPAAFSKAFSQGSDLKYGALDLENLAKEDAITDKISGLPARFAVAQEVNADTHSLGRWQLLDDGRWQWQLTVKAEGATHLNFGFDRFNLPKGAELLVLGGEGMHQLGPYGQKDRLPHGQLWTPVVAGERAVLTLDLAAGSNPTEVDLHLQQVNQGYRGFGSESKQCKSGSCNTDVACLASTDPWNQPRRAVGAYTRNGTATCTGSLVNNTRNDGRMLFATASHCNISSNNIAATVVVYWRYESPTCRTPGSASSGQPLARSTSRISQGLRLLAATNSPFSGGTAAPGTRSDWTLLELQTPPANNDFELYWAGWDRSPPPTTCAAPSNSASTSGLCASIHHPNVDEKRITFVESAMTLSNISGASGVHWRSNWDPTPPLLPNISPLPASLPPSVTEPGSSGSPLYNAQRRLIGVLSGGASFCGASSFDLNDDYGGLFHAWEGLGSATTRMKDHLDPLGIVPLQLDGKDSLAQLSVSLSSPAITSPPLVGEIFALNAAGSGGNGTYTYSFDIDGDGISDRSNSTGSLSLSYPSVGNRTINVEVRDGNGLLGSTSASISPRGATISAVQNGALSQVCGNGDSVIDPGEQWQVPVRLSNTGQASFSLAQSLFAKSGGSSNLDGMSNSFGHRVQSASNGCSYSFIDIASGANAVPALALSDTDDGRANDAIALGGSGITLYGQRYTEAVMSTNGYISFAGSDSGEDFTNSCDGAFGNGSAGPQIRPFHDDLVVTGSGGLRYRYFASCPRRAESSGAGGCHVFQWTGVGQYVSASDPPAGSAEFQAVVYETNGQIAYQYRTPTTDNGADATIGLIDSAGIDPLVARCNSSNAAPAASALCIYTPNNLPASSPIQLTQPVQSIGNLAAAASSTVNVPFYVKQDAGCGAAISLDHIASVDASGFSANRSTVLNTSTGSSCSTVTSCTPSSTASTPRRGLYFNAQRPGNGVNGYFYPEFGDGANRQLFGGLWYTAKTDRSSIWYQLQGQVEFFGGELPIVQYQNTAAPNGFATSTSTVGQAWIGRIDDDSLILAWAFNDGRVGAERIDSIGLGFAPSAQNHTQAWFDPSQSGWGLAIEGLSGTGSASGFEFFASYIYDASGAPRWVTGDKASWTSGTINLLSYPSQCPGCAWFADTLDQGSAAGSMLINYAGRTSATLSTSILLPTPLSGSWTRNSITITPIVDPVP